MRHFWLIFALIIGLAALYAPIAEAELIWGEIQSLRDNGQTMVIRSYDSITGELKDVTVKAPPAENQNDEQSLKALHVGDEVIVDARPGNDEDKWQAYFMNLPEAD